MEDVKEEILRLKKEKNAVILAHNYQRPEVYEVADFIGDSLDLSKKAFSTDAEVIVFCGVKFMAETAKLLNPEKKVLLPVANAGCPLADTITREQLVELKLRHNAPVVCYVNTSADVEAESDYCCTSMNALKIIESIEADTIIFVPDKNLGEYLQNNTNKRLILWDGCCYAHSQITPEKVAEAKRLHPDAELLAHPECCYDVLKQADKVTGTGGMKSYVKESQSKEFIIATEEGMCNILRKENPEKRFYCFGNVCFNMKYTTLESIRNCLKKENYVVTIPDETAEKARICLKRMMELS